MSFSDQVFTHNFPKFQSETSSRKDDKSDSIADNDEDPDLAQFRDMIDSDVELPPHYSTPRVPTPPLHSQSMPPQTTKRHAKSSIQNSNLKRTKTESLPKQIKIENEANNTQNEENEFGDTQLRTEKSTTELEEAKDNLKQILENNFTSSASTDANLSDQGEFTLSTCSVTSCFIIFFTLLFTLEICAICVKTGLMWSAKMTSEHCYTIFAINMK